MGFIGDIGRRTDESALAHVLRVVWQEIFNDHATVIAAGLAYYGLFGMLPGLAAAAAIWSLFGDTGALQSSLQNGGGVVPPAAIRLLEPFVSSVPQGFGGGVALLINVLLVVWTAFRASGGLLTALNIVYDVEDGRSPVRRAAVALAVGVGGITVLFVAVALLALTPLAAAWLQGDTATLLMWLRWPALIVIFAAMLALLFRYAPDRPASRAIPLCWGVLTATALCLLASAGISFYAGHFANYGRLYGTLGGIAIALFWLYACALSLLVGAEIDAVLTSRQQDTLEGCG